MRFKRGTEQNGWGSVVSQGRAGNVALTLPPVTAWAGWSTPLNLRHFLCTRVLRVQPGAVLGDQMKCRRQGPSPQIGAALSHSAALEFAFSLSSDLRVQRCREVKQGHGLDTSAAVLWVYSLGSLIWGEEGFRIIEWGQQALYLFSEKSAVCLFGVMGNIAVREQPSQPTPSGCVFWHERRGSKHEKELQRLLSALRHILQKRLKMPPSYNTCNSFQRIRSKKRSPLYRSLSRCSMILKSRFPFSFWHFINCLSLPQLQTPESALVLQGCILWMVFKETIFPPLDATDLWQNVQVLKSKSAYYFCAFEIEACIIFLLTCS